MPRYTTSEPWSEAGLDFFAVAELLPILDRFSEVNGLVAEDELSSFLLVTRSLGTGLMFMLLRAEGLVSELTVAEPLLGDATPAVPFRAESTCQRVYERRAKCTQN